MAKQENETWTNRVGEQPVMRTNEILWQSERFLTHFLGLIAASLFRRETSPAPEPPALRPRSTAEVTARDRAA
jgi:hypothetical protein